MMLFRERYLNVRPEPDDFIPYLTFKPYDYRHRNNHNSQPYPIKELSLSLFIARRIYRESDGGKQVSRPAVLIAMY